MNSYRHEALAENCKGVPIMQQHGSIDDNVPAYHSRLMSELLVEGNWSSTYVELLGKGHWFDGIMTTDALRNFYERSLNAPIETATNVSQLSIVIANPADMGPKEGIQVMQLEMPGQYGRMEVSLDPKTCSFTMRTSNILAFRIETRRCLPLYIHVDGQRLFLEDIRHPNRSSEFWKAADGLWKVQLILPKTREWSLTNPVFSTDKHSKPCWTPSWSPARVLGCAASYSGKVHDTIPPPSLL